MAQQALDTEPEGADGGGKTTQTCKSSFELYIGTVSPSPAPKKM